MYGAAPSAYSTLIPTHAQPPPPLPRLAGAGIPRSAPVPVNESTTRQSHPGRRLPPLQEFKGHEFGWNKKKVAQLLTVAREQNMAEFPLGGSTRKLRALEKCAPQLVLDISSPKPLAPC